MDIRTALPHDGPTGKIRELGLLVSASPFVVLFTDFGLNGPYTGQVKSVLAREVPAARVIDLWADAPSRNPRAAAYLLPSYVGEFSPGTVFFCVVDPGVGGGRRACVALVDGRWFVGPDNGLFAPLIRRARSDVRCWEVVWRPDRLSATFHGRDLFAPIAAHIAEGDTPVTDATHFREIAAAELDRHDWPDDLAEVVYVDTFGNAMTGLRADGLPAQAQLTVSGCRLRRVETFSDVSEGESFWYENANGLVEIAVNGGRAADVLGLDVGSAVVMADPAD